MALNNEQIVRYSRHILLKGVGGVGQEKLLSSKVLVIGAGGGVFLGVSFIANPRIDPRQCNVGQQVANHQ